MLSIFAALFGGIALAAVTGVASSMAKSQDEQVKNDFNSFQKRKNEFISNMTNISLEREIENSLTRYKYSNKDDEYVRELRKTFGKYYDEPCLIDVPNISNTSYKRNVRVLLANRGYLYSTDLRFGIPVGRFNEYKCIRVLNDEIVADFVGYDCLAVAVNDLAACCGDHLRIDLLGDTPLLLFLLSGHNLQLREPVDAQSGRSQHQQHQKARPQKFRYLA